MKNGIVWLLAGVTLVVVVIGFGWWLRADEGKVLPDGVVEPVTESSRTLSSIPVLPASGVVAPVTMGQSDTALLPLPEQLTDATESMSAARLKGDPTVPPVSHSPQGEAATAAELADPKAYQRYEARQNQRIYDSYVKAAAVEIPRLQQDIARARREGISEEEIRKGEEKLRRIQAMRDQLQADHPQPIGEATAP